MAFGEARGIKLKGGRRLGSIRQTYIKSTVDALLRQHPDEFTDDFNANKAQVEKLTGAASKELRNRVAGYITRKVHSKSRRKQ